MLAKIFATLWRQSATISSSLGVTWGQARCPQPEIQISHAISYPTDEKSTLDQVVAWCHQAPSHYLIQSMMLYDVSEPHWVHHAWWSSKDSALSSKSNITGHPLSYWWKVNIGSGNGLVPDGTKPLPYPMLIWIYDAIWCQQATLSPPCKVVI